MNHLDGFLFGSLEFGTPKRNCRIEPWKLAFNLISDVSEKKNTCFLVWCVFVIRQWGFEKLLFRESRTNIRRDRKYAIQAKNAFATGVHMSENVVGKTLHKTETKIRYYHYHNTITVHEELCREMLPVSAKKKVTLYKKLPFVHDDNMKKLVNTIKEFEQKKLGTKDVKHFS